jgi:hypothetical protein
MLALNEATMQFCSRIRSLILRIRGIWSSLNGLRTDSFHQIDVVPDSCEVLRH